jgi:hypothetical protein
VKSAAPSHFVLLLFVVVMKVTKSLNLFLSFHYVFREKIFMILVTFITIFLDMYNITNNDVLQKGRRIELGSRAT